MNRHEKFMGLRKEGILSIKREIENLKEMLINEGFRPRQVQTIIKHG